MKKQKAESRMAAIGRARRSPQAAAKEQRRASLVGDGKPTWPPATASFTTLRLTAAGQIEQALTQIKNMMSILNRSVTRFAFIFGLCIAGTATFAAEPPVLPTTHTTRNIEGWSVRVDDRLLAGEDVAIGERALKLLTARLVAIETVVPEPALSKLRAVTIELDLDYGGLKVMQYHPDAEWLKNNGYSESLAKCAHIARADDFLSPFENHRMPWVVLHELAHAYHDQVLGFDDALARALHRPAFLPVPQFVVKLLIGEMGREALLGSARVRPARLLKSGFEFRFSELDAALRHMLARSGQSS